MGCTKMVVAAYFDYCMFSRVMFSCWVSIGEGHATDDKVCVILQPTNSTFISGGSGSSTLADVLEQGHMEHMAKFGG